MSRVLIVAHTERVEAVAAAKRLVGWLEAEGHSVELGPDEAAAIERRDLVASGFEGAHAAVASQAPSKAGDASIGVGAAAASQMPLVGDGRLAAAPDLAVSLGGDGTMLRSLDLVAAAGVPVLGVNVGHLGYLTEFEPTRVTDVVSAALAGELDVSQRMMVSATVRRAASTSTSDLSAARLSSVDLSGAHLSAQRGPAAGRPAAGASADGDGVTAAANDGHDIDEGTWTGLNEVVLEKRDPGHTVRLEVLLDGDQFATYAADGLIVSTPTGSTAYGLSAGGAVVAPTHSSLQLTPVAPHMLFDRSLVLPPDTEISIRVRSERPALAAVDGRSAALLQTGDELVVTRAPYEARFVTAGGDSFHRVLKHKFGLKDR